MLALTALPTAWKVAGAALLALAVVIALVAFGAWSYHRGMDACEAKQARAIAEQIKKDQATSAAEISKRDKKIADIETSKSTVTKVIHDAPITSGCGPVVGAALDWLQQRSGSSAPAR